MTLHAGHPLMILVPIDGSTLAEQAIPYAMALAGDTGEIVFLGVVEPAETRRDDYGYRLPPTDQDHDRRRAELDQAISGIVSRWIPDHRRWRVEVEAGSPAETILEKANKTQADLVVIASHGRSSLGRWRFGSVADRVSRESLVPVLVVRPTDSSPDMGKARIRRIVVALDGSERSEMALPIVKAIARSTNRPILLLSVLRSAEVPAMYAPWIGPPVVEDSLAEDFETEHKHVVNRLKELRKELVDEGFVVDVAIRTGDPIIEIEKIAGHTDLVVTTTHGRTGFQRWALGSVSEKLIREGAAPVLVVSSRCRSKVAEPAGV